MNTHKDTEDIAAMVWMVVSSPLYCERGRNIIKGNLKT